MVNLTNPIPSSRSRTPLHLPLTPSNPLLQPSIKAASKTRWVCQTYSPRGFFEEEAKKPSLFFPFPSPPSPSILFPPLMATSSRTKTKSSGPVLRSVLPSSRFCSYSTSNTRFSSPSSAFASSTSSSCSSPSSSFFNKTHRHQHPVQHRSASPTRVNLYTPNPPSSAVRFSIDHRSISPNRSFSSHVITKKNHPISAPKRTCMCSPTSHPGSFRCSLHKSIAINSGSHHADSYSPNRLNMRRSAMKNSLVRIGGVEGEWVKRALTALIRPSSHQQRRRAAFEPRPSRLSVMSKAEGL